MGVKKGLAAIQGDRGVDAQYITEKIQEAYLARGKDKERTKKSFSPSNLGYGKGACPRYWFMAFDGAMFEDNNTAEGHANMLNGIAAHERIQAKFEESDIEVIDVERELRVDDPPIFGYIDLIVNVMGLEAVGEIKTARSTSWWSKAKSRKPQDYHLVQVLIYMHFTGIKHGFLFYENKDDLKILVIPVKYDDHKEYVEEIIDWMKMVRENWENQDEEGFGLPTRPFTKKSKACKSCPLFNDCWEGDDGVVDLPRMEMKK